MAIRPSEMSLGKHQLYLIDEAEKEIDTFLMKGPTSTVDVPIQVGMGQGNWELLCERYKEVGWQVTFPVIPFTGRFARVAIYGSTFRADKIQKTLIFQAQKSLQQAA